MKKSTKIMLAAYSGILLALIGTFIYVSLEPIPEEKSDVVVNGFTEADQKMFDEGQIIPKEKLVIAGNDKVPYDVDNPCKFHSLRNEGDETIVTFSHAIYFDSQWVTFGKGMTIVDEFTGDRYVTRGYTDGFSMDHLLIVKGCNKQSVLISLRFPKLKDSVKRISIYRYKHKDDLIPSNARSRHFNETTCFLYNAPVEDYMKNADKKKEEPQVYH